MAEKPFQWLDRRINDPAHDMLAAFLVMDIQHNSEWMRDLADHIEQVQTGRLPAWERIGNAYRLELTPEGAVIEDLVDEESPAQVVTIEGFSKALEAWIEAFGNFNA